MTATVLPALASRPAIGGPAWPAPMTMASKRRLIGAPACAQFSLHNLTTASSRLSRSYAIAPMLAVSNVGGPHRARGRSPGLCHHDLLGSPHRRLLTYSRRI